MKFLKTIFLLFIGFLSLFLLLLIFAFDFTTSVTPGWHTIVYPPMLIALYITIPCLLFAIYSYIITKKNNRRISTSTLRLYLFLTLFFPLTSVYFALTEPSGTPRDIIRPIIFIISFIVFLIGQLLLIFKMIEISRKLKL